MINKADLEEENYDIWEVLHDLSLGPVKFVCLQFWDMPDKSTRDLLKQSHFLYGYFEGVACWYSQYTPMTRQLAEDIARGAIYGWMETPAWEIPF